MKKILITVLVLLSLFFMAKMFFPNDITIKRIDLSEGITYLKDSFKGTEISHFEIKNSTYLSHEMNTVRGRMITPKKKIEKISFFPELKGNYAFHMSFSNCDRVDLNVKIYKNKNLMLDKIIEGNKNFLYQTSLELLKNDKITLLLKGKTRVILANPVFYKELNPADRQYVFLICADTIRAQQLTAYGYQRPITPNIDALVTDSVLFENAYAQSSWTLPSHISLFTGLYEFNHGIRNDRTILPESLPYLIEELSEKFAARSFNGGAYVSPVFGFCRGFDKYAVNKGDMVSNQASKNLFRAALQDLNLCSFPNTFYFLHTYHAHSPYNPPLVNLNKINPDAKFKSLSAPTHGITELKNKYNKLSDDLIRNYIDLYDAEIYTFDECFGEFVSHLKRIGIYDQSMIILFSDHGEEFFEHQAWEHTHSLYNELIKVPLIIKFPGNEFNHLKVKSPVGLIDILPTILSYYGIGYQKKAIDGVNLLPVLKGSAGRSEVFSSMTTSFYIPALPFKISRIERQSKIIYNLPYSKSSYNYFSKRPPELSKYEVFDLEKDPQELNNLYISQRESVHKFEASFNRIIRQAKEKLKSQLKRVKMNQKTEESLKALGYL